MATARTTAPATAHAIAPSSEGQSSEKVRPSLFPPGPPPKEAQQKKQQEEEQKRQQEEQQERQQEE
eukprot:3404618-Pyramimonas_sp.AAC.1